MRKDMKPAALAPQPPPHHRVDPASECNVFSCIHVHSPMVGSSTGLDQMPTQNGPYDVVVVGGGNSAYTGGGFRMVHRGVETVRSVVPDLSAGEIENTDFGEYTAEQYLDDLGRVTQWYCDPDLSYSVVSRSTETVQW